MQQWVRFSAKVAAGILSAWFLFLPATANALGLGNIKMESALNQPLRAQIELLSATSDDVNELQVQLASREAFLRAGVDRSALLSHIKFNITKRNSKYYVTLTTQESIREPFLNFLVELNWKNGRMLREYTVLLDPAGSGQASQMAQAPETTPPESEPAPAPAPVTAAQEPVPAPTSPFMPAPESAAPAPAETPAKTETAAAQPEPLLPAPEAQGEQATKPEAAPEPMPAPTEAAAPAPEPMPAPEAAPAPAPAPTEAATPAPEQPFETAQGTADDGRLFPAIPLHAYRESDLDKAEAAPAPEPVPAAEGEAEAGAPAPMPSGELDYGITKKGDNLWSIAEKLKPSDQVTVYQVMMALQQSNPKAFVNGNVHRLKVGQVMRIDDPSLLTSISKHQALQEFQSQTRDWENYLASTGHTVPRQTIVAGEQPPASSGSGVPSGELTLASPQAEKNGAGSGGSDVASSEDAALLEQQARKAMQEAKKARQHNAEVSAKLDELDAELKKMENLVTVKNSDLAELQRKLNELNAQRAAAESAPTPAETAPETAPVPTTPEAAQPEAPAQEATAPEAAEAPAAGAPPAPPPVAAAPEASAPTPPGSEATPAPEETPSATEPTQTAQPSTPTAPPVAAPPAATAPTTAQPSAPQSGGIMGTIKGMFGGLLGGMSAMVLIVAGVVVVVVLLLIFIIVRRRKGSNFQESILTGVGGDEESVSLDSPSQESSLMGGESSFLSDFAISGVSAIQAEDSEVDPLTEADVFMAYGRYEAAEERLQEAVNQDPKRGELRVKLLELFNTTKDKQAFESAAEDFYASLGSNADSNPLWQKVVAMGRELVPGNPLFSGGVVAASPSPTLIKPAAEDKQSDVMDIGLDTGVFNTSDFSTDAFNEPAAGEPAHTDSGLDFNLDIGQPAEETHTPAADDMDFSLDFGSESSGGDEDIAASDDLAAGLDFSLDSGDEPTSESLSTPTHDDMDLSFNLDGDEEPTATEIKLDEGGNGSGGLDFDFAMDSDADTGAADTSDASVSLDALSGGDEVGTKLDLARAYIDMGDPDGARSILDEVMEEGNDGQRQEAQQLMTQIG